MVCTSLVLSLSCLLAVPTSTATPALPPLPELNLEAGPLKEPPVWRRGWFWAVAASLVVVGVVSGLAAAQGGERCFCVTPAGVPCDTCD